MAACTSGSDLPPLAAADTSQYRLGAGDQVRVITYDEPQLTNTFTVGGDGTIAFPLIGTLRASGDSAGELAGAISTQLRQRNLLRQPSVSAEVTIYRSIFVLGEVTHPGQYPFQPGMTMLSAVALAGGFTYRAVENRAGDVRTEGQTGGHGVEGRIARDTYLQPGDVVTIYERYF